MPVLGTRYTCGLGARPHPAFLMPGRGGAVVWCRTHGILAGVANHMYPDEASKDEAAGRRRMNSRQLRRFWGKR